MPLHRGCAWAGASIVALSLASMVPAQAKPTKLAKRTRAGSASRGLGAAMRQGARAARVEAQVSRPQWEVGGSSIAPAAIPEPLERSALTSPPRASHAWITQAPVSGAVSGIRLAAAPLAPARSTARTTGTMSSKAASAGSIDQDTARATMSVSAPSIVAANGGGRVTVKIEVPAAGASSALPSTVGRVREARPGVGYALDQSAPGVDAGAVLGGPLGGVVVSEEERRRREGVAVQQHFARAQAAKKQAEQEMAAKALADSEPLTKRLPLTKASLTESVRSLEQFRGVLQRAYLEAGPDATGMHPFVRAAQRYAGVPYVWGGESRTGFDCSGLIIVVMRDLGYKSLPHSAAEQFNYGMPVARALLKPGDLVFFANTYKPGISHVGIYLGQGRFIHAAGTGKGTIVSHLSASPYAQKYAGARRLFKSGA